jgi:hypothetical protein
MLLRPTLMRFQRKASLIGWLLLLLMSLQVEARGSYQTPEAFLKQHFNQTIPASDVIWMKGEVKQRVKTILGHDYLGLRIRYWHEAERTAWVLEEIGKEEPITFGVIVKQGKIESIRVLTYRESRGGEIRYPAFTRQFDNASMQGDKLDRHIDGISGATLSVWAMTKIAKLALYLDELTRQQS